jgi:hypothetical protein
MSWMTIVRSAKTAASSTPAPSATATKRTIVRGATATRTGGVEPVARILRGGAC